MKNLILLAGAISLAACSQSAPEAEAPVETAAVETPVEVVPAGTYTVTYADGTTATTTITAEGTFSGTRGDVVSTGSVARVDGKTCFDADGDEEGVMCWTDQTAAADGSWVATSDAGEVVTVKPDAAS